jgi:hypothetical protein
MNGAPPVNFCSGVAEGLHLGVHEGWHHLRRGFSTLEAFRKFRASHALGWLGHERLLGRCAHGRRHGPGNDPTERDVVGVSAITLKPAQSARVQL